MREPHRGSRPARRPRPWPDRAVWPTRGRRVHPTYRFDRFLLIVLVAVVSAVVEGVRPSEGVRLGPSDPDLVGSPEITPG